MRRLIKRKIKGENMEQETKTAENAAATNTAAEAKRPQSPEEIIAGYVGEELEKYNGLGPAKQAEHRAKLWRQIANQALEDARALERAEIDARKAERTLEAQIKEIIKLVRNGTLEAKDEILKGQLEPLGVKDEKDFTKHIERIKQDSIKKTQQRLITPAKPAWTPVFGLVSIKKSDIVEPTDGSRPEPGLNKNVRTMGMLEPITLMLREDGKYDIFRGRRRYWLLPNEEEFQAYTITGFPDEATKEKAMLAARRNRSLNTLYTSQLLANMQTRGMSPQDIRRDLGFKTGEVEKITSLTSNLKPELQAALRAHRLNANVAISIAKLSKAMQSELVKTYQERVKADPDNARLSEVDVQAVRQARAAESASQAAPQLAGVAGSVEDHDSGKKSPPKVDNKPSSGVNSKSPLLKPAEQNKRGGKK